MLRFNIPWGEYGYIFMCTFKICVCALLMCTHICGVIVNENTCYSRTHKLEFFGVQSKHLVFQAFKHVHASVHGFTMATCV